LWLINKLTVLRSQNVRNKLYLLVLTVIVSVFAMLGCGGGGGGSNPAAINDLSGETASLSGSVILEGQPQANVTVNLYKSDKALNAGILNMASIRAAMSANAVSDGAYTTSTNDNGEFSFAAVPLGEYTLIAGTDENQFAQTGIVLNARASTTTVNAQLTPTGRITGKVRINSSQNVAGAIVYISGTSYVAFTNSLGEFELTRVPSNPSPAAVYEIQVVSASPKGTAVISAIIVAPGQVTALGDINLTPGSENPTATINGSISQGAAPAAAIANKLVILAGPDKRILGAYTNSSGQYSFSVETIGEYQIRVVSELSYSYSPVARSVNVAAFNAVVTADAFTVSVMDGKEGSKISGTITWNHPSFSGYSFQTGQVVVENTSETPLFFSSRPVQNDGAYSFDHIPPGTYSIRLDAAKNGFSAPPLTINTVAGTDYPNRNLTANYIAPYVSNFSFAGSVMTLTGGNFSMSPNQTSARANETPLTPAGTWTTTSISFEIGNLPPGQYNLRLSNPTNHAQSQIFNFTRNLDAPTGLTVAEISDRHARIKWVNAPFALETEVELWQGANKIGETIFISANSFEFNKLMPDTSYQARIRSKYNNLFSGMVLIDFTTNKGISSFALASSVDILSEEKFGFAVNENNLFVGAFVGDMQTVVVRKYGLNGSFVAADEFSIVKSGANYRALDLVAGLEYVYVLASDTLLRLNPANMTLVDQIDFNGTDLPSMTAAKIEIHGQHLFVSSTYDNSSVKELRVNRLNPDLTGKVEVFSALPTLSVYNSNSYHIRTVSDGMNLFVAYSSNETQGQTVVIKNFGNLSTLASPFTNSTIVSINNTPPRPDSLADLKFGNGSFYLKPFNTNYYFEVNSSSGFTRILSDSMIVGVDFDSRGNMWASERTGPSASPDAFFFNQKNFANQITASIKVNEFVEMTGTAPSDFCFPGVFVKSNSSGTFFLTKGTSDLMVFKYDGMLK